jgi:glycerol-3-phosphate acyltransferase PlsY
MAIFLLILSMIAGYILGSVNTAIIAGNIYGENIRNKGSGNAGLTNALRVMGPKAAVLVFFGDVLKGVAACLLGYLLTAGELGSERIFDFKNPNLGLLIAGISCIIGHMFPVFFQFKGGKGVLTSATVVFMMDWRIGAILICIFIIIVLITRYVSVSSMIAAACLPIAGFILEKPRYNMVYTIAIALLVIIMHRKNIGRLISGTEPRLRLGR